MQKSKSQYGLFLREFRQRYHTTGAILPSGQALGRALARHVGDEAPQPKRILEVGPGTGTVTRHIIRAMGPDDQLDIVEVNESFVECLQSRLDSEPEFQAVAQRVRLFHGLVEELDQSTKYDRLVSGVPLNNFSVENVKQILSAQTNMLATGGVMSFFQYIWIRSIKSVISGAAQRNRLRGVGAAIDQLREQHEIRREAILPNAPPAWVHHLQVH